MTWEEAKDQIARTQGYTQWDMIIVEGVNVFGGLSQIEMLEEAAKLYAREACIGFLNYTMHGTVDPDPDSRFRIEKMMEGYNELLTSGEPSNDKNPVIPATIKSLVDKYCGATLSNKHKTWKSLHKAMESDLMAYAREVADKAFDEGSNADFSPLPIFIVKEEFMKQLFPESLGK